MANELENTIINSIDSVNDSCDDDATKARKRRSRSRREGTVEKARNDTKEPRPRNLFRDPARAQSMRDRASNRPVERAVPSSRSSSRGRSKR